VSLMSVIYIVAVLFGGLTAIGYVLGEPETK
jgi:hypothetical protein